MISPPIALDVTFSKQRRKNGWFLVEKWPGQKTHIEYGPMPEDHLEPVMNQIVQRHQSMVADDIARRGTAAIRNLVAIPLPGAIRRFDPKQESQWLKEKRNPLAKR